MTPMSPLGAILYGLLLLVLVVWAFIAALAATSVESGDWDAPLGRFFARYHPWASILWPLTLLVALMVRVPPGDTDDEEESP